MRSEMRPTWEAEAGHVRSCQAGRKPGLAPGIGAHDVMSTCGMRQCSAEAMGINRIAEVDPQGSELEAGREHRWQFSQAETASVSGGRAGP